MGPEFTADGEVTCAVAGADFVVLVDGGAVDAPHGAFACLPARGFVSRAVAAARARTLAVSGGFDVRADARQPRDAASSAAMGPFGGRPLKAGDCLPVGERARRAGRTAGRRWRCPSGGARVRVMPGRTTRCSRRRPWTRCSARPLHRHARSPTAWATGSRGRR